MIQRHLPVIGWKAFSVACILLALSIVAEKAHGAGVINQTVAVCDPGTPTNCEKPSAAGAITEMPADAVNFNNTTLANGTVANGLFSSGTVVNPSTNQVLLGPIDMTGAQSIELTQTFTSGSGVTLQLQESSSPSGPWSGVLGINNGGLGANSNTTNFPNASNGSFKASPSGRYTQIVAAVGGTETLSISGYLRTGPASTQLANPAVYAGSVATQLNGAAGNLSVVQPATSDAKYLVTVPYSIHQMTWQTSTAGTDIINTTPVNIGLVPAAGVRNYITDLHCSNSGAGVATEVEIIDNASAVIVHRAIGTGPSGQLDVNFLIPKAQPTTAAQLTFKALTTGASLACDINGYQAY